MEPLRVLKNGGDHFEERSSRLAPGTEKMRPGTSSSLNQEILAILKITTDAARVFDAAALETSLRRSRTLFRRPVTEREINAWKRAGRI